MFLEIIIFSLFGVGVGTLTGILPGLHPNSVLAIVLTSIVLLSGFPVYAVLAFIVALSVTNTFTDFIPSLLFGAPEEGSELAVLPGHEMMLEGKAYEALFLTVVGGLGVVILTILTFPLLIYILPFLYSSINSYIHYLLIFVVLWMIISENKKGVFYSILIFSLSGIFGIISLGGFPAVSLFPALTGMFGISGLIVSLKSTEIPKQNEVREVDVSFKGIFIGWISGLLVGILPGIGSSQAGTIASNIFKTKTKDFLTALGGINTSNIMFTFIAFYTLEKTRSGAAAAVSQILFSPTLHELGLMVIVGLFTTFIAAATTLKIGKIIIGGVEKINYHRINLFIIIFLIILTLLFSDLVGLLILFTGTLTGLLAIHLKVRRSHMMGFFLLPTILYFSGLSPVLSLIVGV